jgi:hypothetical protein
MATTHGNNPSMTATRNAFGSAGSANRASAASQAALLRKRAMQQIKVGAVWFVLGLVITVITFQHPIGGFFIAAYGPIIFGAISVVRGLVTLAKSAKLS